MADKLAADSDAMSKVVAAAIPALDKNVADTAAKARLKPTSSLFRSN